eukprot:TRINITY_DN40932_c0_g2_i2.p1 TRINITY_DN40932_c0_g2~~TRINITY_DN40932_c0_g2_i2.p1  ORF type:complete len:582 (+),score=102.46 TRINITY_DN40932_c0_g2_i2:67-1746(+)
MAGNEITQIGCRSLIKKALRGTSAQNLVLDLSRNAKSSNFKFPTFVVGNECGSCLIKLNDCELTTGALHSVVNFLQRNETKLHDGSRPRVRIDLEGNPFPFESKEGNLHQLSQTFLERGSLICSFGGKPEEESTIAKFVGDHEAHVKCRRFGGTLPDFGKKENRLGFGAFGSVYRMENNLVVKRLHLGAGIDSRKLSLRELTIWSLVDHPNVLHLLSLAVAPNNDFFDSLAFVMERYDLSLDEYLERVPYDSTQGMDILQKISEALRYLHSQDIIHRDLHSFNVLGRRSGDDVDGINEFVISDLGCSKNVSNYSGSVLSSIELGRKLTPPEYDVEADCVPLSFGLDLISFGILMWQVLTCRPNKLLHPEVNQIHEFFSEKLARIGQQSFESRSSSYRAEYGADVFRSFSDSKVLDELLDLMLSCLDNEPARRMKAKEVCHVLESLSNRDLYKEGVYVFVNGDIYEGHFRGFEFHGEGSLWLASGDFYRGQWIQNKPHGWGSLHYASGGLFRGNWEQGRRQGLGSLHHENGDVLFGAWNVDELAELHMYITVGGELFGNL